MKFPDFRHLANFSAFSWSWHFITSPYIIAPFRAYVNNIIDICPKLCYTKDTEKETRLMNYLTYLPVFDKLTKSQQDTLTSSSFVRKFGKGELLNNGSQKCTGLILILSGQIRAFTISDDGREITMYRLFERDICLFSASCIMNSIQFDITVTAEKETEVLVIPSEVYKSIMDVSAPLANYTNEVMASRFSDVMWLIDQVMWKSFDKRLADFLLNEANIEGTNILKITHETIGNHLGNPREVVTRMLKYLVSEGLISLSRGTIEIIDKDGLEKIIV
jgi:CRP/FNR family transcriptional regulator